MPRGRPLGSGRQAHPTRPLPELQTAHINKPHLLNVLLLASGGVGSGLCLTAVLAKERLEPAQDQHLRYALAVLDHPLGNDMYKQR